MNTCAELNEAWLPSSDLTPLSFLVLQYHLKMEQ